MRLFLALPLLLTLSEGHAFTAPVEGLVGAAAHADEVDNSKSELINAIRACDRITVEKVAAALAKHNAEKCAEGFAAAFKTGVDLLAELEKEREKGSKEMKTHEIVRDKNGVMIKGDPGKYFQAKRGFDQVTAKIEALQTAVPHLTSHVAKLSSPAAAKGLAATLRAATEWPARAACAEALGRIEEPEALEALLARAKIEEVPAVKVALTDALGLKAPRSEDARKVLVAWTDSPFWQIRLAAAQGLARSGDRRVTPTLIGMLVNASGRMRDEINQCLKKLTGVDKHGDHAAWKEWWETNREDFLEGKYVPRASERGDAKGLSTFYGIPLVSTHVAFVIDSSLSMNDPTGWRPEVADEVDKLESDRAIDVARHELKKIIRRLPENAEFNIIAVWANLTLLAEKMTRAGRATRESSIKFVQGLQLKTGTDLYQGIARALEHAGGSWNAPLREDSIDTIYLLSDGKPSVGLMDRTQIADRILDAVRYKKVVLHCIAVGADGQGRLLLKTIAEGSGGQFVLR